MLGLATVATMGIAYLIAKGLDKAGEYKQPTGKNRKRYK